MGVNPDKIGTLTADAKVISNGQHFQPGKGPSKAVIVKLSSFPALCSTSTTANWGQNIKSFANRNVFI